MPSEWYLVTTGRVEELKQTLLPRDVKEYRLDKLQAVARRIDEFAISDQICQGYKAEIDKLIAELYGVPLSHARNKAYICSIGAMISHLKKTHHLVNEDEYIGLAMIIGLIAGTMIGIIIGNAPLVTIVGIILGLIAGINLDTRAKRSGRTI